MQKRNGLDNIAFIAIVLSIVLLILTSSLIDSAFRFIPASLGIASASYAVFRILSTNVGKRRYENDRFTAFFTPSPYRYFRCPECKTKLRVPKGKGKIKIKCPKCGHQIIRKT